jgi:hypothetical protein
MSSNKLNERVAAVVADASATRLGADTGQFSRPVPSPSLRCISIRKGNVGESRKDTPRPRIFSSRRPALMTDRSRMNIFA